MEQAYISGSLTGLSDLGRQRSFYEQIGHILTRIGYRVHIPHQHSDPLNHPDLRPSEVYRLDHDAVAGSDLLIAYVGIPSHGVGQEVEIANQYGIPIVLLFEESRPVSRMVRGNPSVVCEVVAPTRELLLQRIEAALCSPDYTVEKGKRNPALPGWM